MRNLRWRSFGDLLAIPLRNGLNRPTRVRGSGVKMVNMGELFAYPRIGDIEMERVPVSEQEALNYSLKDGDLLFARQSLVYAGAGKCSIFVGAPEAVTFEGHLIRARLDQGIADPYFYFYLFNSEFGRRIIETIVEQVAAAGIRGSDLAKLDVPYLPIESQRAIAHILGSLDDKIELNRRMNATLEAMARAIFKSWFVDFDPVHAKARGEQPAGMDAETAALFPDSFEESELGLIPEGWRVEPIGEAVTVVGGSTPRTDEPAYWEGGTINWVTPKDLASLSSPVLLTTSRCITEEGLATISSGLLPSGTVLLSSRAPIGYLAIAGIPVAINQGFIAMICEHELSNHYVLWWTQSNMDLIKSQANGTTFLEISKRNFRPILAVIPPQAVLRQFDQSIDPIYRRLVSNLREARKLAEIRDTLLPRLISGEIRVEDVEQSLKEQESWISTKK